MNFVADNQIPGRNPTLACHIKRMVGRGIDSAFGRFKAQYFVTFFDENLLDFFKELFSTERLGRSFPG
jgi:hypothetical protein